MADQSFFDQNVVNPVQNAWTSLTKGTDISGLPYDAQAAALARRQKLAEMLMQQGQAQPEVMSYKGIAAQPSVAGGIGRALSQFMGAYMGGKAEEDAVKLEKTGNENFIKSLGNYYVDPGTPETKTPETNVNLNMPNIPRPVFDRSAGALVPGNPEAAGTTPTNFNIPAIGLGDGTPSHTRTLDERMAYDLSNMSGGNKAQSTHFATQYAADAAKSQAMAQLKPQVLAMLNDTNTDPAVKNLLKNAFDSEDTDRLTKIMNTIDVNAVPKAPTAQELSDNRDFAAAKLLKPSLTRQQWNADNAGLTEGAKAKARIPFAIQQASGEEQARKNVDEKHQKYAVPVQIGYTGPDGEEVQTAASWDPRTGQYLDASTKTPIANPQNLRVIGNATGGARSQAAISRVLTNASDATSGIENLSGLRAGSRSGIFANVATTPAGALTRTITTQEARDMQITFAGLGRAMGGLATSGLAVDKDTQESYTNLIPKAGDSQITAMRQMAELKQQSTNALDVQAKSPVLTNEQKKYAAGLSARIKAAIPWSVADVEQLEDSGNSSLSLRDIGMQKTNTGGQAGGAAAPGARGGTTKTGVGFKILGP